MTALERGSHEGDTSRGNQKRGLTKETLLVKDAVFNENTKLKRKEGKESKGAFARYLYTIVRSPRLA
jgi:hypothetical protein